MRVADGDLRIPAFGCSYRADTLTATRDTALRRASFKGKGMQAEFREASGEWEYED